MALLLNYQAQGESGKNE